MPKYNIIHIEVSPSEPAETGRLYETLFGWKTTPLLDLNPATREMGKDPRDGAQAEKGDAGAPFPRSLAFR